MGRECAVSGSAGYDDRVGREPRVGVMARPPVPAWEEMEVGGRTVGASASVWGEAGTSADRSRGTSGRG